MNYSIIETRTEYSKKPNTKTVWQLVKQEFSEVSEEFCRNVENSAPFFRRLGGSETIERGYTYLGYRMVKCTSTSPDKQTRIVREYKVSK